MAPLMDLLSEGTALHSDGGGKATAPREVLTGREAVARFFLGIAKTPEGGAALREAKFTTFNGAPGVLLFAGGHPVSAMSLEIREGKIATIFAHRNPDKLRAFEGERTASNDAGGK